MINLLPVLTITLAELTTILTELSLLYKIPNTKEETFQVVLDALALTPCYLAFLITADVPEICPRVPGRDFDVLPSEEDTISFLRYLGHTRVINSLNDVVSDQMHQPWRTFAALISRSLSGKTTGLDKLRLSRAQILWGMYHQKNIDYVELLWEDFTDQIDNKVYKKRDKIIGMHTSKDDYLINTLRFISRKEEYHKYVAVLPKCLTSPTMKESKAYKTYLSYATGTVPPKVARKFKKASPSKKDSVPVQADEEPIQKGKRVKRATKKPLTTPAVSIVIREPTVETQSKRKEKQKTHPSGSGTVAEDPPSVAKITPTVTSEGNGDKPRVLDVTNDDSSESESESWGNDEDDSNEEQVSSDEGSEQEIESEDQASNSEQDEESEDDDQEEEEFVHTPPPTNDNDNDDLESESDDVTKSDEEKGIDDAKEIVQHEALEKEVDELKKDPLHTQVTSLVDSHLDTRLGETREEFMNFLSESLTARIKEQVRDQLPQILPQEVSTFAPPVIEKMIEESRNEVILAKVSSQPPSSYEAAATLTEFELKKILIEKMEKSKLYLTAPQHRECYDGLKKSYELGMDYFSSYDVYSLKRSHQDKGKDEDLRLDQTEDSTSGSSKTQPKSSRKSVQSVEPVFEVADSDMPQDQEGNRGDDKDEPRKETTSRHDWFKKPAPPQEPTVPDWNIGKTTQE
ncbi:hypothetical protein Tco_1007285 [Tanacetum coccineum]